MRNTSFRKQKTIFKIGTPRKNSCGTHVKKYVELRTSIFLSRLKSLPAIFKKESKTQSPLTHNYTNLNQIYNPRIPNKSVKSRPVSTYLEYRATASHPSR